MKIGQTSIIVFVSKVVASAVGFLTTLYFARVLGAEILGIYALVMTVVGWSTLVANFGISQAASKRISESDEEGAYLAAALVLLGLLLVLTSVTLLLLKPVLETYITDFSDYVTTSVVWFVILLLAASLFIHIVKHTLRGQQTVHISGLIEATNVGLYSLIQFVLVLLSFGLLGMLVGYLVGGLIAATAGVLWFRVRPTLPEKRHFRSLFEYARYSWLSGLKAKTFNQVDILILGIFVPSALVGVYSIAWSIAKFLDLFGAAVRETMFPEISQLSAEESKQAAAGLITDSLAYTGLIAIPGLVGGSVLAERLLRLYGDEFVRGTAIFGLLILAVLVYSYLKQLMNGLNAIDRPDLAFRVNITFILTNSVLNFVLIWAYGIEGAAVATVVSTVIALLLAYYLLSQLISFGIPVAALLRQAAAATVMGGVVFALLTVLDTTAIITNNAVIVVGLSGTGAMLYFVTLLAISTDFRETVDRNSPVDIPLTK